MDPTNTNTNMGNKVTWEHTLITHGPTPVIQNMLILMIYVVNKIKMNEPILTELADP